jgi:hypothetical protein
MSEGKGAGASVDGVNTEQGKIIMSKIMSKIGIGIDSERQIAPQSMEKGPQMSGAPESWRDFILHDADGQLLMPRECPESGRGKAESRKRKVES